MMDQVVTAVLAKTVEPSSLRQEERLQLERVDPLSNLDVPGDELEEKLQDPLVSLAPQPIDVLMMRDVLQRQPLSEQVKEDPEQDEKKREFTEQEQEQPALQPQVEPEVSLKPPADPGDGSDTPADDPKDTRTEGKGEPLQPGDPGDDGNDKPDTFNDPKDQKQEQKQVPQETQVLDEPKGTTELGDQLATARPSLKPRLFQVFGSQLNALGQKEQQDVQDAVPTFQIELKDNTPLANKALKSGDTTKVDNPALTPKIDNGMGDFVKKPKIKPTQKPGTFQANKLAGQGIKKLPENSDAKTRAKALNTELTAIKTHDDQVDISPGPAPSVPVDGGKTDKRRADKALNKGMGDAHKAQADAKKKVLQAPGSELVKPQVVHETKRIGSLKKETIEGPDAVPEMDEFLALDLDAQVRSSFDSKYSDAMTTALQAPRDTIQAAVDERDQKAKDQITQADEQSKQLKNQAQAQQDKLVTEQRRQIEGQKQSTLAKQKKEIAALHQQADNERKKTLKDVDAKVKETEHKVDREYDEAGKKAAKEVKEGEAKAKKAKEQKEAEADEESWWDSAVSAVSDMVDAVAKAVTSVLDAVRSAVSAVLDAAKAVANRLIDAACDFISSALDFFATLLKGLIDKVLGRLFPQLAAALTMFIDHAVAYAKTKVKAFAENLKKGISAMVDGLKAGLDAVIGAFKSAVQAAAQIAKAVLKGDWGAVLYMVLESVLALLGIPPKEFKAMVGDASQTIQSIVKNPGGFLDNLIAAMGKGFSSFGDNFQEHLQTGFLTWLTGMGGSMGIKLPKTFDVSGVFDIVLQVMGLSGAQVEKKIAKRIGADNVKRIKWVAGMVGEIWEKGPAQFFVEIQKNDGEKLDNLYASVVDGIKDWLLTRIVMKALAKLAMMFNPVGAIIQVVMTAWNIFNFLKENVGRIAGVFKAIAGSIIEISMGKISGAAKMVEDALAKMIPVAIDLLAKLVGLTGVAKKVKTIIEGIQGKIDKAIDGVIDRFAKLFRAGGKDRDKDAKEDKDDPKVEGTWDAQKHRPVGISAKTATRLSALSATGTYSFEFHSKPTVDRHFKKGDAYDFSRFTSVVESRIGNIVGPPVERTGDAMFGAFGTAAWGHFAREAKPQIANLGAPRGLKLKKFELSGDAPQGREATDVLGVDLAREKISAVTDRIEEKAVDLAHKAGNKAKDLGGKAKDKLVKMSGEPGQKAIKAYNQAKDYGAAKLEEATNATKKQFQNASKYVVEKYESSGMKDKVDDATKWMKGATNKVLAFSATAMNAAEKHTLNLVAKVAEKTQPLVDYAQHPIRELIDKGKKKLTEIGDEARRRSDNVVNTFFSKGAIAATKESYKNEGTEAERKLKEVLARDEAEHKAHLESAVALAASTGDQSKAAKDKLATVKQAPTAPASEAAATKPKDEKGRLEPDKAWEHPSTSKQLLRRHRFAAGISMQWVALDLGDKLETKVSSPQGTVLAQHAFWEERKGELKARASAKTMERIRYLATAIQINGDKLKPKTGFDVSATNQRDKLTTKIVGQVEELATHLRTAYEAFNGWNPQTEAEKKKALDEEAKKKKEAEEAKAKKTKPDPDIELTTAFDDPVLQALASGYTRDLIAVSVDFELGGLPKVQVQFDPVNKALRIAKDTNLVLQLKAISAAMNTMSSQAPANEPKAKGEARARVRLEVRYAQQYLASFDKTMKSVSAVIGKEDEAKAERKRAAAVGREYLRKMAWRLGRMQDFTEERLGGKRLSDVVKPKDKANKEKAADEVKAQVVQLLDDYLHSTPAPWASALGALPGKYPARTEAGKDPRQVMRTLHGERLAAIKSGTDALLQWVQDYRSHANRQRYLDPVGPDFDTVAKRHLQNMADVRDDLVRAESVGISKTVSKEWLSQRSVGFLTEVLDETKAARNKAPFDLLVKLGLEEAPATPAAVATGAPEPPPED